MSIHHLEKSGTCNAKDISFPKASTNNAGMKAYQRGLLKFEYKFAKSGTRLIRGRTSREEVDNSMISDYTKDNPMILLKKSGHETACKTHLKNLLNDSTHTGSNWCYVVLEYLNLELDGPEIPTSADAL